MCFEVFGNVAAEKVKHIQITFAAFVRAEIVNQSAVIIGHRRGVLNFRIGFLVDSPRRFIKQARIINISVDVCPNNGFTSTVDGFYFGGGIGKVIACHSNVSVGSVNFDVAFLASTAKAVINKPHMNSRSRL